MTPREVLETLAVNLNEFHEERGWNWGQFPVYKQDLHEDETIADAVEIMREIFGELDIQVIVTSDGVLYEEYFYVIRIRFVCPPLKGKTDE